MSFQNQPQSHSAVIMTEFGDADVLKYQGGLPIPQVQSSPEAKPHVLVKVAYAGINPVDYKTRLGLGWGSQRIKDNQFIHNQPAILGFDMAGYVVESSSVQFKVGDRVAAVSFAGGCYAEYAIVAADILAKVPDSVTLKVAGALPCVGVTAKQMIDFANIQDGEHVVMSAPAGGVGHLALQMLMQKIETQGIKLTVICSADKYDKLKNNFDINKLAGWIDYIQYKKGMLLPEINADLLLDLVGGDSGSQALSAVKEGGRVVVLPSIWADKLKEAGSHRSLDVKGFIATPNADDLTDVLAMVEQGEIKLHIQCIYPLAETSEAHKALETGKTFGKIVLEV